MDYSQIEAALSAPDPAGQIRPHDAESVPDRKAIIELLKELQTLLFPGYYRRESGRTLSVGEQLTHIAEGLTRQIGAACRFVGGDAQGREPKALCDAFMQELPYIRNLLVKDIEALYAGDPAASCREEVLLCYPGFYAISIYRLAHLLYTLKVPLLPRIMTEYAHEKTGIDIHAGATIGEYFFIDHGTGIVVGETTVIGDHVKLYQGVTLGAKSFELDENGNPVKNIKRHPNIGSHVIIYANATILGGSTTIGDGCTIGGNVWLTHSVEPGQVVYYTEKK